MKIEALKKYRKRHAKGSYFEDLPANLRQQAAGWLQHFKQRQRAQGKPIHPWLLAIYVGQAKRLTLNPPSSGWGRSMRAKKGGYAAQQAYRWEDRGPTAGTTAPRAQQPASRVTPDGTTARGRPGILPPGHVVTIYRGKPVPGRL
jgi:hypothetical protein